MGGTSVKGLKGCKTLNKHPDPNNPVEGTEERSASYLISGNPYMEIGHCNYLYREKNIITSEVFFPLVQ